MLASEEGVSQVVQRQPDAELFTRRFAYGNARILCHEFRSQATLQACQNVKLHVGLCDAPTFNKLSKCLLVRAILKRGFNQEHQAVRECLACEEIQCRV